MKKRCIAVILLWVMITCFGLYIRSIAYADPFTASQIGSLSYAMMQSWGVGFTAGNATATGMNNFMAGQVEDYVNSHGGSIADLFIGDLAVNAAGQLAVGQQMYNSVVNFLDWMQEKYTLSSEDFSLTTGEYKGDFLPTEKEKSGTGISGVGLEGRLEGYQRATGIYSDFAFYVDGVKYAGTISTNSYGYNGDYYVTYEGDRVVGYVQICDYDGVEFVPTRWRALNIATIRNGLPNRLSWSVPENWSMPTVLNPDQEWTGTIGGYSEPDTNLDQLLGDINQAVADNNLVVDGEVIDIPVPPEPMPTWTPVDDVIDGINQQGEMLEGIGNDIGDISGHLGDLGEQIGGIEESLEGVQEGIQAQTGVISGAIDQATSDVVDAIGEQTAALDQTLTDTAEGVQDIVDALEPGQITPQQFDLRRLFPFCIPFDIHNLLQKFDAEPVAPHVQLPFVIQSIGFSYTFDLDFSAFNSVAAVMRSVELIVFAIGLAWATSKVIKW